MLLRQNVFLLLCVFAYTVFSNELFQNDYLTGSSPTRNIDKVISTQLNASESAKSAKIGMIKDETVASDFNQRNNTEDIANPFQELLISLGYSMPIYGMNYLNSQKPSSLSNSFMSPNYRLGPGDEVNIRVWGSVNLSNNAVVDSEGKLDLAEVGVVNVAGLNYSELKSYLNSRYKEFYRNFEMSITLGELRHIQVYMTGVVKNPGVYSIKAPALLSNLLLKSRNISKKTSLRRVQVLRANQLVAEFDLYEILKKGIVEDDVILQEGDVVHFLPVDVQVAMTNGVGINSIFEVLPGESLKDIIEISSGLGDGFYTNFARIEFLDSNLTMQVKSINSQNNFEDYKIQQSQIITFQSINLAFENSITIRGFVNNPKRVPYFEGMKIKDVIGDIKALIPRGYSNYLNKSSIEKFDMNDRPTKYLQFNWDYATVERFNEKTFEIEILQFDLGELVFNNNQQENLNLQSGDIITLFNNKDLQVPFDRRPIFVTISGEVNKVGTYKLKHGETLQDLLEKANGVTNKAYLFGTNFYRKSVQAAQKRSFRELLIEMRRNVENQASTELGNVASAEEAAIASQQVEASRNWLNQLGSYEPSGRLILELDPTLDLDVGDLPNLPLENGDEIVIPTIPSMVSIFGEVPMQNSFVFKKSNTVGDYISKAGGFNRFSDDDEVFVIRADGSVVSESEYGFLFWQLSSMDLLPGDVIFVPKEMNYSRWLPVAKDLTQILANAGVAVAAIIALTR